MVEPITLSLIVGAAAPPLIAALGKAMGAGDRAEADRIRKDILRQYGPEALAGIEQAATEARLGPSEMAGVQTDPVALAAQRQALQRLQEGATTQGLTPEEKAEMEAGLSEAAQYEQGQRGAIMANAQDRGISGSGMEMASQLQAQQAGAMRASRAGTEAAAMAARRRALANLQQGQLAGSMRGQGFEEQSAKARAADEIARWNADVAKWKYGQTADLRDSRSQAMRGRAGALEGRAQETAEMMSGIGSAAGQAAGAYGQYEYNKQKRGY